MDDKIKIEDFDFDKILLYEESYENILVYSIFCKTLIGTKPLRIKFDKVNGIIRVHDWKRYSLLFGPEKYDAIYNKIRYLIVQKSCITYVISHNFTIIKVDSFDCLSLEEIMLFHNVIILTKSDF